MSLFQVEKRFGFFAVKKGFITEDQLAEAMMIQIEEDLCGLEHRLVGQILLALGYINELQISLVLNDMHFPMAFCSGLIDFLPATGLKRQSR